MKKLIHPIVILTSACMLSSCWSWIDDRPSPHRPLPGGGNPAYYIPGRPGGEVRPGDMPGGSAAPMGINNGGMRRNANMGNQPVNRQGNINSNTSTRITTTGIKNRSSNSTPVTTSSNNRTSNSTPVTTSSNNRTSNSTPVTTSSNNRTSNNTVSNSTSSSNSRSTNTTTTNRGGGFQRR